MSRIIPETTHTLFQKTTKTRDMTNQAEFLQHNITIEFLPYGSDMPYRIIVGNNPVGWVDPLGLDSSRLRRNINKGPSGVVRTGSVGDLLKVFKGYFDSRLVIQAINEADEAIYQMAITMEFNRSKEIYILYGETPVRFVGLVGLNDHLLISPDVVFQKYKVEGLRGLKKIDLYKPLFPIDISNQGYCQSN